MKAAAALLVLGLALVPAPGRAVPTLVADERLHLLSGHPDLGRGYSGQSNTLSAICFDKVAARTATFDYSYEVRAVTEELLARLVADPRQRRKGQLVASFVRDHVERARRRGGERRFVLARVDLEAYDRTLDESASSLAAAAQTLLREKHFAAFFARCGFSYVRSVRTLSTYLALLEFRTTGDAASDAAFLAALEQGFLAFGQGGGAPATVAALDAEAERRELRAYVTAHGLSKGDLSGLVPLSVAQFRDTIQGAAKLMQDPDAGVVTAIEVVPWIDHPDVGVLMAQSLAASGDAYMRLQRVETNSFVVVHVGAWRQAAADLYARARLCLDQLETEYPRGGDGAEDPAGVVFYDQSDEGNVERRVSLAHMRRHFEERPPERVLVEGREYLEGRPGAPGAFACVDALTARGLDLAFFPDIPGCSRALLRPPPTDRFLDDHCPPKRVRSAR